MIEKDEVCDRIKELFEENGSNIERFGVSPDTLKRIIEKKGIPRVQTIRKICKHLNMTLYDFFQEEKPNTHIPYAKDTFRILELYRRFTPEWQNKVFEICQKLAEVNRQK